MFSQSILGENTVISKVSWAVSREWMKTTFVHGCKTTWNRCDFINISLLHVVCSSYFIIYHIITLITHSQFYYCHQSNSCCYYAIFKLHGEMHSWYYNLHYKYRSHTYKSSYTHHNTYKAYKQQLLCQILQNLEKVGFGDMFSYCSIPSWAVMMFTCLNHNRRAQHTIKNSSLPPLPVSWT